MSSQIVGPKLFGSPLLALIFWATAPLFCAATEVAPGPGEIESSILAARRHITSGEFRIVAVSNDRYIPELSYHIWFDGSSYVRQERNIGSEQQVSIFNEKSAIYYSGRSGSHENPNLTARPVVRMVPIREASRDRLPFAICDPLVAMLVPVKVSLWPRQGLESLVKSNGRDNVAVRASTWKGNASVIVTFDTPKTGNSYEYEAVPSLSYNIVRWRMSGKAAAKQQSTFECTADCDLIQLRDQTWFPHIIHLVDRWDGSVKIDESSTLNVLSLNQPVDREIFTLRGSGLPPKQLVVQALVEAKNSGQTNGVATTSPSRASKSRAVLEWDGSSLKPLTATDRVERELSAARKIVPKPSRRVFGMPLGVLTLTTLGCASGLIWLWITFAARRASK